MSAPLTSAYGSDASVPPGEWTRPRRASPSSPLAATPSGRRGRLIGVEDDAPHTVGTCDRKGLVTPDPDVHGLDLILEVQPLGSRGPTGDVFPVKQVRVIVAAVGVRQRPR